MKRNHAPLPVLVFGASGSIGQALCARYISLKEDVFGVSREAPTSEALPIKWLRWDKGFPLDDIAAASPQGYRALVWCQGVNFNDDIDCFDLQKHMQMYEANVVYILESLSGLIELGVVPDGARLCVISSIWQDIARQKKLSYCISKAALAGLVRALAIDLGKKQICINAVLPGPLDTPMTRANLSSEQLKRLESATPLNSLPALDDVTATVEFLCSEKNPGITGQFVAADRGYSNARFV